MTRNEYIQKVLAIYKLVHKPNETQLKEAELLLEMIPDKLTLKSPDWPLYEPKRNPFEPPIVVMYGVQVPDTMYNESNSTVYTISKTDEKGK